VLFVPVFAIWGGVVPKSVSWAQVTVAPFNGLLSLGYLGVITAIVTPELFLSNLRNKFDLPVALGLALVAVFAWGQPVVPLHSLAERLGPAVLPLIGWAAALGIAVAALVLLVSLLRNAFEYRHEPIIRFATTAVVLISFSNVKVGQFSSRYIVIALPFLLLAIAPRIRLSAFLPLRLAIGAVIGLSSLATYFHLI
jgi:hypothetical protein